MSAAREIVESLRERVQEMESSCHAWGGVVPSGCGDLDRLLVQQGRGRGFERGTLVEWIGGAGSGAATLAFTAAREACGRQGVLVVVDSEREFYPPAAAALGIDLARTVVVQPQTKEDYQWSMVQVLSSPAVAAVVCWPDRMPGRRTRGGQERMFRRWQLAAERGGVLVHLVRGCEALAKPSWARVRLLVEAQSRGKPSRCWRVTRLDAHAEQGELVELEMDHETGKLQSASALPVATPVVGAAHPSAAGRTTARAAGDL